MNDLRLEPTSEPPSLDDRLRHDGAAYRGLQEGWVPDLTDVSARSRRQHRRSRQALAVAVASVAVLGAGGVGLRAARSAGDQELHLGGSATSAPTTSVPPTTPDRSATSAATSPPTPPSTTVEAPTSAQPTSTTAPPTTPIAPSTTLSSTPVDPAVTTSLVTPATSIQLRADGLGLVSFGDPEADVMARLTAALGPPTVDSGWIAANAGLDPRPNRSVMWGGFTVGFLENASGPYLAAWRISVLNDDVGLDRTPALATPDGLRIGLRYEEIEARLDGSAAIAGAGATGYRVTTAAGPIYLWFDPPHHSFTAPPGADATLAALDAGDPMSAHEP